MVTASPLLLHQADAVALLVDGRVAERGTHEGLLHSSPAYRRVVERSMVDSEDPVDAGVQAR